MSVRVMMGLLAAAVVAGAAQAAPKAPQVDQARVDAALKNVLTWKEGQPTSDVDYLAGVAAQVLHDAQLRPQIEQELIDALPDAQTQESKAFICRQLAWIGTDKAIPALAKLLADKEASHMARYALERLPGPAADEALRAALPKVDDRLKVGLIYSIGRRSDAAAVPDLTRLIASGDPDVAVASLVALSRIQTDQAVAAIAKARASVPDKIKPTATNAYLDAAAALAASGKSQQAAAIYQEMFGPDEPAMTRIGALSGLIAALPERAAPAAIGALNDKDEQVRQAAANALRDVKGADVTKAVAAEMGKQDEKVQPVLLAVLADRGDKTALPAVLAAAGSGSEAVRVAALEALGRLGDGSVVPVLVQKAAAGGPAEQRAARGSLERLQGATVNAAIARELAVADAKARAEAARALGARAATEAVPAVLKAADDRDPAVQIAAFRALGVLAGVEQLPALAGLLVKAYDEQVRAEAEQAVVSAAKKAPEGVDPAAAVLAALKQAAPPAAKASLLRVLGRIAHPAALEALSAGLKDANAEVRSAAVRAFADWPDATPIAAVAAVAQDKAAAETDRIIALRGYINMIARQPAATDDQIIGGYQKALALATRAQEKQLVLSKLALLRHRGALELATKCLDDPELKASAAAAIQKIQALLAAPAKVSASHRPEWADLAIDGKGDTRWTTDTPMKGGEWFRIELDQDQLISGVVLDASGSAGDYPRSYEVYIATSSIGDGKLIAKGKGNSARTEIKFAPVLGRSIKIVQTGSAPGNFWSIHTLEVIAKPKSP